MDFLNSDPMPVADHFLAFTIDGRARTAAATTTMTAAAAVQPAECLRAVTVEVCEKCVTCHADKQALWKHVREMHGDDLRLTCPAADCGRRFSSLSASATHWSHHVLCGGRLPYTCELCGRLSNSRSAFDKHMVKEHPDARAALCGVCGLYAGDVAALTEHVRAKHGARIWSEVVACNTGGGPERTRRTIRCDVCGKRYGNNRLMRSHRQVHGGVESNAELLQEPQPCASAALR